MNTRTIIITTITLNKNHPVEGDASLFVELATDTASDGDKIDNSLFDFYPFWSREIFT